VELKPPSEHSQPAWTSLFDPSQNYCVILFQWQGFTNKALQDSAFCFHLSGLENMSESQFLNVCMRLMVDFCLLSIF
jgi:hypothetical protein